MTDTVELKNDRGEIVATLKGEDISYQVFGKYTHGFRYAGFDWSDEDESGGSGVPKYGAMSAPGKTRVRVKYVPWFRFWQWIGVLPENDREA